MKHKIQVNKEHYLWKYEKNIKRWRSYHEQMSRIIDALPNGGSVLEVGVGTKFLYSNLKRLGYAVTSVDFDKRLKPDYVGDVTDLPFKDNSYDVVCAFEVLEHLPFEEFQKALQELKRVSKKTVLFSVPYAAFKFHLGFRLIPYTEITELEFHVPYFLCPISLMVSIIGKSERRGILCTR